MNPNCGQLVPPVPDSESVVRAVGFLPIAFKLAVTAPVPVGANCTVTVHDFRGPRLVALHVSDVIVSADPPDNATFNAELALPPVFFSVNL
jgi:hypothetical protein